MKRYLAIFLKSVDQFRLRDNFSTNSYATRVSFIFIDLFSTFSLYVHQLLLLQAHFFTRAGLLSKLSKNVVFICVYESHIGHYISLFFVFFFYFSCSSPHHIRYQLIKFCSCCCCRCFYTLAKNVEDSKLCVNLLDRRHPLDDFF